MGLQSATLGLLLPFTYGKFDQKISLFLPSNLSTALILEPKDPQPPYSNIWASLGSLDLDQQQNFSLLVLISNQVSQRHGILNVIFAARNK